MDQTMDVDTTDELNVIYEELHVQHATSDQLSDDLNSKLNKLSECEMRQLYFRKNKNGVTPLLLLLKRAVEQLLKPETDPNFRNSEIEAFLQLICVNDHKDLFQYLVENEDLSAAIRANAHELMGAVYIVRKGPNSRSKAIEHWKKALRIRLNDGGPFVDRELSEEPLINDVHEFRTMEHLDSIENYPRFISFQALLIIQRILGNNKEYLCCQNVVLKAVTDVYDVYMSDADIKDAFPIIMRIILLKRCRVSDSDSHEYVYKAAIMILYIAEKDGIGHLATHFDDLLTIVDILWSQLMDPKLKVNVYNILPALLDILVSMSKNEDRLKMMKTFVTKMVKKNCCNDNGRSLLHVVASVKRPELINFPKLQIFDNPRLPVVQLLLECGHDVDALDNTGNSPLHLAVSNECDVDVVNCLLEHGAHIDRINAEGIRPCHLLDAVHGFNTFNHVTLKCLAARTIADHGVMYKHVNFLALDAFIAMH